jgi:hypothetical protein
LFGKAIIYLREMIAGNDLYILAAAIVFFIIGISSLYKHPCIGIPICLCGLFLILIASLAKLGVLPF